MRKPTLLYAEDDQETRENYMFVLKHYFHHVYTAGDGEEALRIYHEKKPDVLLLDISIPRMDGLEVVQQIRQSDKNVLIVMLTAHSERDKLLRAVPLKLETYLLKPVDDDALRKTMLKLIKRLQDSHTIDFGDGFSWDSADFRLSYGQHPLKLTKKESFLLEFLGKSAGGYSSRDGLIFHIWHNELPDASHENKLTQLVYRLNKKIALETGCTIPAVENSYALGYRLRP